MKVVVDYPPMFEEIDAVFRVRGKPILFAWHDAIFNPMNVSISDALIAHEAVHMAQQKGNPEGWWRRYLSEKEFRLREEVVAHQVEFLHFSKDHPRSDRRRYLSDCARRLSGPLYGSDLTVDRAKALIMPRAKLRKTA